VLRLRTPVAVTHLFCNGSSGSDGIGFTVEIANTEMRPLVGRKLAAVLEDVGPVHEETFNMV
jgi:hypothetical protein